MADSLSFTGDGISGTIHVPGDKSISHRAALFAALANGPGDITGFLDADDTHALLGALSALGIRVERPAPATCRVHGIGAAAWHEPDRPLDLGNSGTALRLLAGVLAGRGVRAVLTGDPSLRRRPMLRVVEPLQRMGARIGGREGTAPLTLGGGPLHGVVHTLPVASAQVVSALLLAGLHADGETWISSPAGARDHTERMLGLYGIPLLRRRGRVGVSRADWDAVAAQPVAVPADPSSAAFFAVAAALVPGSEVTIPGICANPTRTGFVDVLTRMGADVGWARCSTANGGEPVGDLQVRGRTLRGVRIGPAEVPALIDELPVLMVAAAVARGQTVIAGAGELRHKESDRLSAMAAALRALGATVHEMPDGVVIDGGVLRGGTVDAQHDHRIAMSAAVAALRSAAPVRVRRCAEIATSFPGFVATMQGAGMEVTTG